ncbi:hypothetical protein BC826DRAFT_447733 [Russula brevipes]|nr:hypothetical protein BC826DRAFT_447733 [Russula brevipes]
MCRVACASRFSCLPLPLPPLLLPHQVHTFLFFEPYLVTRIYSVLETVPGTVCTPGILSNKWPHTHIGHAKMRRRLGSSVGVQRSALPYSLSLPRSYI